MDRLRIVIVTPKAPDPFGSSPTGWYYLIPRGLAERGHRVTCLSAYDRPRNAERAREALAGLDLTLKLFPHPSFPWLKRKWRTIRRPYSYFISDQLQGELEDTLRQGYDVLHLDDIWTGYLGIGAERSILFLHHLLKLDFKGMDFVSRNFFVRRLLGCLAERNIVLRYRNIRIESEKMAKEMRRLHPSASLFTIPCAIDTSLYDFRPPNFSQKVIGFVAAMSWHLGRWTAERLIQNIWPKVKARVPDAELLIVGWGARQALAQFLDMPDVTILENVPDTEPYFRRLSALTYPLPRGSGMKVKVLEAMAYGVPVVTTTDGIEGVEAEDGVHAFIADDDDSFVERTVALLSSQELRERMSRAARKLVDEEYSLPPTVRRLEAAYETILNGRQG